MICLLFPATAEYGLSPRNFCDYAKATGVPVVGRIRPIAIWRGSGASKQCFLPTHASAASTISEIAMPFKAAAEANAQADRRHHHSGSFRGALFPHIASRSAGASLRDSSREMQLDVFLAAVAWRFRLDRCFLNGQFLDRCPCGDRLPPPSLPPAFDGGSMSLVFPAPGIRQPLPAPLVPAPFPWPAAGLAALRLCPLRCLASSGQPSPLGHSLSVASFPAPVARRSAPKKIGDRRPLVALIAECAVPAVVVRVSSLTNQPGHRLFPKNAAPPNASCFVLVITPGRDNITPTIGVKGRIADLIDRFASQLSTGFTTTIDRNDQISHDHPRLDLDTLQVASLLERC